MIAQPSPKEETVCSWPNPKVTSLQDDLKVANDTIADLKKNLDEVSSRVDTNSQAVTDIKEQVNVLTPVKEVITPTEGVIGE